MQFHHTGTSCAQVPGPDDQAQRAAADGAGVTLHWLEARHARVIKERREEKKWVVSWTTLPMARRFCKDRVDVARLTFGAMASLILV